MASRAGAPATYKIQFDSNAKAVGEEGASALELLRQKIGAAENAVKGYEGALKRMNAGSVVNIDTARALKQKIQEERDAIATATEKIVKAGASYEKLTSQHEKLRKETEKGAADKLKKQNDALKSSIEGVGGPVADLKNKLSGLSDIMTSGAGAEALLAAGAAAVVLVAVAGAAAIGALTLKLAEFIITSGDMLRNQQLMRAAFDGSEEDAARMGNQVEALARKLKLPREEINKMASELSLAGLGGQRFVDALNAIGQTSAALGSEAGDKVKELTMRGKLSGRAGLGATELRDAHVGFQFNDVAAALAKNLNVPLAEAGQALVENRVKADDFDAALAKVTKDRFGGVNTKNMFSLDVLFLKAKEAFESLTKGVNLEPLLAAFKDLAGVVDDTNEAGASLKLLIEQFGGGVTDGVTQSEPIVKSFIEELINGALDAEIAYLDLKIQLLNTFGDKGITQGIDGVTEAMSVGKGVAKGLELFIAGIALNLVLVAATAALIAAPFAYLAKVLKDVYDLFVFIGQEVKKLSDASASLGSSLGGAIGGQTGSKVGKAFFDFLPGFASGLERVPSDDFPARLHKDERVLTADEAKNYNALFGAKSAGDSSSSQGAAPIQVNLGPIMIAQATTQAADDFVARVRIALVPILEEINRKRGFMPATPAGSSP